jgi:hypothetical protein
LQALRDPLVWAESQFGGANLGDRRRTERAIWYAAKAIDNSSGAIPQQAESAAGMKAVYRLFAARTVTHEALLAPHLAQTRRAASGLPLVFLIQDTSELNFSSHVHCVGLGSIGCDHGGHLRGLDQQNVLAVDPVTARPLGLMYQKHHRRVLRPRGHGEDRKAQRAMPMNERESGWWLQAIDAIGKPPAGVRWVHVGDRGEDFFGAYDRARANGTDWLIRAARDRTVITPGGQSHLFEYARSLNAMLSRTIRVRDRANNSVRQARLSVATGPVILPPVKFEREYRGIEPVVCNVVRVWEADGAQGQDALEWILLTSLPCEEAEQLALVATGYSLRWQIEEFHKCEKTGCQVEARRLEHTDRLEPLIGLLSVVAISLLMLEVATMDTPSKPAAEVMPADAVAVMAAYLRRTDTPLTAGEFWRGIGKFGGHPGRKGDGPLGWLRARRGRQSFQLILLGTDLPRGREGSRCGQWQDRDPRLGQRQGHPRRSLHHGRLHGRCEAPRPRRRHEKDPDHRSGTHRLRQQPQTLHLRLDRQHDHRGAHRRGNLDPSGKVITMFGEMDERMTGEIGKVLYGEPFKVVEIDRAHRK